ncbi:hypothetical protein G9A89_019280 [Geosiphon pyriformis]|nr:hypothetical protein G9A89_019280 [Geosiphon pyriformis]
MNTSYDGKLECEIGKNMGYSADNKSDEQLDSCTNIPKAKYFNSGMVNALSLGLCDFGSAINDFNMGLSPSVSLKLSHCPITSVKKKLCFKPTKFFALNIGLLAVLGSTLCDKLKDVRSLFYKIDGFRGASTPSKFPGIVQVFFTSDSSFTMAKQLAVSKNLVINTDLKKIGIRSDWKIVIKEILVNLPKSAIKSALSILLDKNSVHVAKANTNKQMWDLRDSYCVLLYTLLIGMTAHNLLDLVQLYGRKTCYISRNLVSYTRAHCAVICFDSDDVKEAAVCSIPVFRGVNLIWTGLSSPKYTTYENFGHVSSGCESGEKDSGQNSRKKKFLCSDSDKRCLVLIYAKKQTLISHPVFFSGMTWASVVSGSPKNSFSILLIENNLSIGSVDGSMPMVMILALHVSVLKHSLENVLDQVADISRKLDRLLAVLSANFAVPPSSEHNLVLDMAIDISLFVLPVPSVVTAVS